VKAYGYYEDEVRAVVVPLLEFVKEIIGITRKKYIEIWQDFLPRLRVFSVSEKKDNILMWSHYADYHTGVVFKLNVLPDLDNPLCVAKPIIYKSKPPTFFTAKEWIDDIIGVKSIDHEKLSLEYAYIKSDVWSYENEWRVWDLLSKIEPKLYSDYPLQPKEVGEIYYCKKCDAYYTEDGCHIHGKVIE